MKPLAVIYCTKRRRDQLAKQKLLRKSMNINTLVLSEIQPVTQIQPYNSQKAWHVNDKERVDC